jgi:hypothetical protein
MPAKGNSKLKREVRARTAETGENYTTALRRIQEQQRQAGENQSGGTPTDA